MRRALQRIGGSLLLNHSKTEEFVLTLTLPASLIVALQSHRYRKAFERTIAGSDWVESGLVFTPGEDKP